jgi:hypothetical protein
MQVSALNLIIAAQQARTPGPPHAAKPPEPSANSAADTSEPVRPSTPAVAPVGSQVDIRV